MDDLSIRDAQDDDAEALIALISMVYAEYAGQGVVFDLEELPELKAIESHTQSGQGQFWVAEVKGRLVGCIGWVPVAEAVVRIERLYVAASERQLGIGGRLLDHLESERQIDGARTIELWTDTRFRAAHRFYERRGYMRGETRQLEDKSRSAEFFYQKTLA